MVVIKKKKKSKKAVQPTEPSPADLKSHQEDQSSAQATSSYDGNRSPAVEENEPWASAEREHVDDHSPSYQVPDSDEFRNVWDGDK